MNNSSLSGVKCSVKNCAHNQSNQCHAKSITVGPQFASCSGETVCDTFKAE